MVIAFFLSSPRDFDVVRNCGCCAGCAAAAAAVAVPAGPAAAAAAAVAAAAAAAAAADAAAAVPAKSSGIPSRLSGPTARPPLSTSSSKTCHFWRLGQYLPRVPVRPLISGEAKFISRTR